MKKILFFILFFLSRIYAGAEEKTGNKIIPQKEYIFLFKEEVDILNKGMHDESQRIVKNGKNARFNK